MATPVRLAVLGFVMVMVSRDVAFTAMVVGAKVLVTVGAVSTVRVAEAVVPVPPLVELTGPVVLALAPVVGAVTATEIVQVVPAGVLMVPPLRLMVFEAAVAPVTEPPQVLVSAGVPATTRSDGNVSLKATPASATVLPVGFVSVKVNVEVPLIGMLGRIEGLGDARRRNDGEWAVLDATPVPSFVEVGAAGGVGLEAVGGGCDVYVVRCKYRQEW